MDDLDREFNFLAASATRTACVQQDEVKRFLETAPRRRVEPHLQSAIELPDPVADVTAAQPSVTSPAITTSIADQAPRSGTALASHLYAAYKGLIFHVAQRKKDYESLPDLESRGGAVTEMRQLVTAARSLHSSLSWLDAAHESPLDLGTRYLVEQIAAKLVSPDAEITVVAAIDSSYATVTNPFQAFVDLSDARPAGGDPATVVLIPRREQRSGLLHPLIIHELAHAANRHHSLAVRVMDSATKNEKLIAALGNAAKTHANTGAEGLSAAIEMLVGRLASWVEEAVCDAFGAQILGPTYLYSFMTIVGTSDLDTAGEEHPPTRLRIRLLLKQLDGLGWKNLQANASEEIDEWFRATAARKHIYEDIPERFCVDALTSLASDVRSTVASHVGHMTFRATAFTRVRKEIESLLAAGIPPSQTLKRKTIDRSAIILGSWLFAVAKAGGGLDALAVAADVPELSHLLPKALQDAAVLEARKAKS